MSVTLSVYASEQGRSKEGECIPRNSANIDSVEDEGVN